MLKKPTADLMDTLRQTNHIDDYIKENQAYMTHGTIGETLTQLAAKKGISKSAVIKRADLNEVYGYQIFSGKRTPSRDKLFCLTVGLELSLEEIQQVLKAGGFAPLYPKNKRDSILIFGILHQQRILDINQALFEQGEKPLE